jgi:hypothetical protein|tara:strand:+ start:4626 stop:5174 length:549 start_codon:yes stop_codon:yes gene_type:complete
MAYPKITVNTGLAKKIIASDTIPIPAADLPTLSGTTTATTANKLVDVGADFSNVSVQDIIYNTTDNTSATVTAIDSSTILSISADIFTSPEDYSIFLGGPNGSLRINSAEGCLLYVGSSAVIVQTAAGTADPRYVDIRVKTISGNDITFENFPVGNYLPIQITQLYVTSTAPNAQNSCIAIW